VYDDYAHHPVEIKASIEGIREKYSNSRVVVVFQPHLYTRTKDHYKSFAGELSKAGKIILLDIYPAREVPIEGITSGIIYDELKKLSADVTYLKSDMETVGFLKKEKRENDVIIFQGAGSVTELCDAFIEFLEKQ
jgi:UDP-N-acetylmuramate--alanine ligase